ncbi:MAG: competence protein CoiA family protein [Pseudomonadota bacterium]
MLSDKYPVFLLREKLMFYKPRVGARPTRCAAAAGRQSVELQAHGTKGKEVGLVDEERRSLPDSVLDRAGELAMESYNFLNPLGLKGGALVHVDEVPRGLACDCVCPGCGGQLVAKKGPKMAHHFAHSKGEDCGAGYESALHIAAKDALLENHKITLPMIEVKFSSYRAPIVLESARTHDLESVVLEKRLGNIVPDVLVHIEGEPLIVEMKVTHEVDSEKFEKVRALGISAIEIDLSDLDRNMSLIDLKEHVVDPSPRKKWLHNVVAQTKHDQLVSSAHLKRRISRGMAGHIDYCPLPARVWKGKPYANIIDDCMACRYAMEIGPGRSSITCAAFNAELRDHLDDLDGA